MRAVPSIGVEEGTEEAWFNELELLLPSFVLKAVKHERGRMLLRYGALVYPLYPRGIGGHGGSCVLEVVRTLQWLFGVFAA